MSQEKNLGKKRHESHGYSIGRTQLVGMYVMNLSEFESQQCMKLAVVASSSNLGT